MTAAVRRFACHGSGNYSQSAGELCALFGYAVAVRRAVLPEAPDVGPKRRRTHASTLLSRRPARRFP